ncbi:MAG: hypothetical protein KJO11_05585 [Gemmatimonadetes bacterium]|nr:hypothetical protein [Gemmatimonadota bacterium]
MKLVLLLYLEDDDAAVVRLLEAHGVSTWSRVSLEGHGAGAAGWYGEVAPYRSRMVFTVVTPDDATALVDAVATLEGLADPRHPVHALQLDVERSVASATTAT